MAVAKKWSSLPLVPGNEINENDIVTGLHNGTNANFKLKEFSDYSIQNVKNELDVKLNTMIENGLVDTVQSNVNSYIDEKVADLVQNGLAENVKNDVVSQLNGIVDSNVNEKIPNIVSSVADEISSQVQTRVDEQLPTVVNGKVDDLVYNGLVDNVKNDINSQLTSIVQSYTDQKLPSVAEPLVNNYISQQIPAIANNVTSNISNQVRTHVNQQLPDLVETKTEELIENGLIDNVKANVNSQLPGLVSTYVDQKVSDIADQTASNLSSQVENQVNQQLPGLVEIKTEELIENGLVDNVKTEVNAYVDNKVGELIENGLVDNVKTEVNSQLNSIVETYVIEQKPDIINQVTSHFSTRIDNQVNQQLPGLVESKTELLIQNGLVDNIKTEVNQQLPNLVNNRVDTLLENGLPDAINNDVENIVNNKLQNYTTEERVNELIDEKTGQYISDVPIATDSTIGGVKIGEGLSINSEGLLSVNGNIGGSGTNSNAESFFKHDGITMQRSSGGSFVGQWNSESSLPGPSVNIPINVHDIYLDYTYDGHKETLYFKLPDSYTDSFYLSLFNYLSQDNWKQIIGKNIVQSKTASPTQMTQSGTYARGGNFPSVFASNFGDFLKDDLVEVRVWLYSSASNYGNTESAPNATFNARATSDGYITAGSSSEPLPSPLQSTFSYSSDTGINLIADRSYVGYYYYVEMELKERTAGITQYNYPIKYITSLTVSIDSENKISQIEIYASGSVNQFIVDFYDPLSRKSTKELIDMALDDFLIRIEELIDAKIAAISPSNPGIFIGTIPDTATYDDNFGAWGAILENDDFASTFNDILNGPYTNDNNPAYISLNPTSQTYIQVSPVKRLKLKKGSNELDLSESYSKVEMYDRRDNATVFFKMHAKQYSSELQYNNPFADFAGGTVIFEWE